MPNGKCLLEISMTAADLKPWTVYMIRCCDGSLYTGITTDIERRVEEHSSIARNATSGVQKGAKALRGKGPLKLVLTYAVSDRSIASKLEYMIKRLNKTQKESLVSGASSIADLAQSVSFNK